MADCLSGLLWQLPGALWVRNMDMGNKMLPSNSTSLLDNHGGPCMEF